MNANFANPQVNKDEEKLASGDAHCSDRLILSPSLADLLPLPEIGEQFIEYDNIWRYPVKSVKPSEEDLGQGQPKCVPIGSLRRTLNQESSKQEIINQHKSKKENKIYDRCKNLKGSHSDSNSSLENQPKLNYNIVAKLFLCQACHLSPMITTTVHMCKQGHQECSDCFRQSGLCVVCGEPLEGGNRPLEAALQKLKLLHPELFLPQCFSHFNEERPSNIGNKRTICQLTHKPIQCPHLACRKTLTYSGFLQHFKFDHSTVSVLTTTPETTNKFTLQRNNLNSIPRVVIVFKVSLFQTGIKKLDGYPVICCLQATLVNFGCVESLAVWCSAIYESSFPLLGYSLKSSGSRRSLTYHGPVASLHEGSDSILAEGRCLIVPAENKLQQDGVTRFQINFFIND